MRCEESDEAPLICGVPLELILRQGQLSVFSIGTSLDDATWRAKVMCIFCVESVVHEHIRTAIIEKCRGHAANPYVKNTESSSSLLTRLGLMRTSSPRTFNTFITLAMARRCSCASFFNGRTSSQFTVHSYTRYKLLARDPRITQMGYTGPGSASLGMSPRRHGCDFG